MAMSVALGAAEVFVISFRIVALLHGEAAIWLCRDAGMEAATGVASFWAADAIAVAVAWTEGAIAVAVFAEASALAVAVARALGGGAFGGAKGPI